MTKIVVWSPCCEIWTGPIPNAMQSIYLEQTFVCRVDIQLIFKSVRKNKKAYTKCKSEKIPVADSAPRNRS